MTDQQSPSPLSIQKTVTISDLRRSPTNCFDSGTVAVTLKGETVGYLMSPEDFQRGLELLAQFEDPQVLKQKMGLTDHWLQIVDHRHKR